jgi:hypothetical protein
MQKRLKIICGERSDEMEKKILERQDVAEFYADYPPSHLLIEILTPSVHADQMELVLAQCCERSGDSLLAKDQMNEKRSVRYLVLLANDDESRIGAHVSVLISALKQGLLSFTLLCVPLLVKMTLPDLDHAEEVQLLINTFPFKERGSAIYASLQCPRTRYITHLYDSMLDENLIQWFARYTPCYTLL